MTIRRLFSADLTDKKTPFPIEKVITPVLSLITRISEAGKPLLRKRFLKQEKLIEEDSLLDEAPETNFLEETTDSKFFSPKEDLNQRLAAVLGHLHGGRILEGSYQEMVPAALGAFLLKAYLADHPDDKKLKEMFCQFGETAEMIHQLSLKPSLDATLKGAETVMKGVGDLEIDESFFLSGKGVSGRLNYTVVYEFKKTEAHSYDLFVYSMKSYDDVLFHDRREWIRPYKHYKNIPSNQLFVNGSPDFFKAIIETRLDKTKASPAYTIQSLLDGLHRYLVPSDQEMAGFISSAQSHTDAWSSIKPILYRHLGKEKYKRFVLELKMNSLIQGFQLAKETLHQEKNANLLTILEQGTNNVLAQLTKMEEVLPEETLKAYRATALDLEKRLSAIKQKRAEERLVKKIKVSLTEEQDIGEARKSALMAANKQVVFPKTAKTTASTKTARLQKLWKPTRFATNLKTFLDERSKSPSVDLAEVEHLVAQFAIPETKMVTDCYWNKIREKDLPLAIEGIASLLEVYDKAGREGEIRITPKEANTVFTLYVVLHFLSLREELRVKKNHKGLFSFGHKDKGDHPELIASYPLPFPGDLFDKDAFHAYFSSENFYRRWEIREYCESTHKDVSRKYPFLNLSGLSFHNAPKSLKKDGHLEFFAALIKNHSKLKKLSGSNQLDKVAHLLRELELKEGKPNAFKEADLWYVRSLFNAYFVAYQFSGYTHLRNDPDGALKIHIKEYSNFGKLDFFSMDFGAGDKKYKDYPGQNNGAKLHPTSDQIHPRTSGVYHDFPENKYASRTRHEHYPYPSGADEGSVLKETKGSFGGSILRSCLKPSLQPHQLIYHYRNRLDVFADPQEQTVFEIEFFRSVLIKDHGEAFPLEEELWQRGFVQSCQAFIEEGIESYYSLRIGDRPNILATLFFLRLSDRLARFTKKPLVDSLSLIDEMLKIDDLTQEERSNLSLHLLLSYSADTEKDLTIDDKKKIFQAWVYYKNTPLPPHLRSVSLEKEVLTFLHTLSPPEDFETSDEFRKNLLDNALKWLGAGGLPKSYIIESVSFPNIKFSFGDEFWEVNLLTGKVCNEEGFLMRGVLPKWIPKESISRKTNAQELFSHLFKDREHAYLQTGTTIHFHDPVLGTMRVVEGNILKGLQRRIGSDWYQYVHPLTLDRNEIPKALLADHTHWVPIHEAKEDHLFFSDFESGEPKAMLVASGKIHPVLPDTLTADESRTLYFGHKMKVFTLLDQEGYITFQDHKGEVEKISYSRFRSQSDEPLYFDVKEGEAIYGLNKKFHLSELHQEGLLGGIPNYLLLVDAKGEKQKILVPRRSIGEYHPLTDHHKITQHEGYKKREEEYNLSQKERFTFLEYDLKNGEVIPLSTDGRLHLAYLYLASREYDKAKALIDMIDFRESLSPLGDQILSDIINICEKGADRSPSSAAIVLTAHRLARRAHSRMKTDITSPYPSHAFRIYYRNQGRIPAKLEVAGKIKSVKGGAKAKSHHSLMDGPMGSLNLKLPFPGKGFHNEYSYDKREGWSNYKTARDKTEFLREEGETRYGKSGIYLTVIYSKGYTKDCFFKNAYQIAKSGTREEKEQLRFRLQTMEGVRRQKNDPKEPTNPWLILQFALRHPDDAPDLPDTDDIMVGWKFLITVNEKIQESKGPVVVPLPAPEVEEEEDPSSPLLKVILPKKREVRELTDGLVLETPSKQEIDGDFVPTLFNGHLVAKPKPAIVEEKISFTYDPSTAQSKAEKEAESAVAKEYENFAKDFDKGVKRNHKKQVYEGHDLEGLNKALTGKSEDLETQLNNLEVAILEIANRTSPDEKAHKRLLQETKLEQELTMKRLIGLYVIQDRQAFLNANPHLNNAAFEEKIGKMLGIEGDHSGVVVDYLYNLIGLYLTTAVYKKRLDRANGHCKKLIDPEVELPELEREDLIQKIASELDPKHLAIYETHDNPLFLAFEYLSGFSIRPEQAKHLRKMLELKPDSIEYKNRVTQMIMGGGKTTVLAVILLKRAATKGRLSLFITPSSQYSSVAYNLRKALKEYFDQEMEEVDFVGDQIYKNCGEIKKRLEKTMRKGDFLIVRPETLLCLQLKFLTPILEAVDGETDKLNEINTLREILKIFREHGEALIDEVDLVLHILREMNIPLEEEQHVAQERIDIIRQLFLLFVTDPNLKKLIGLEKNRQTLVTDAHFKGIIAKTVARKLAKKFAKESGSIEGLNDEEFELSFYGYISGKINTDCQKKLNDEDFETDFDEQDKKDYAFLHHVHKLRHEGDQQQQEIAHQIALVKHMMTTVLPMTFKKMGNRHYGRSHKNGGEVTPYLAVDTPSTNHFGYIYEWIAFHFQTAIQCKIDGEQLKRLAEIYREGAINSLKAKRLVLNEKTGKFIPPEAYEFEKMTGISLDDIDRPGKLEEALQHLNSHPEYLLQMEADTASDQVVYHPFRLTANGISLVNMVNARVMSATPHNAPCYEDCLAKNFKPQWGTEGSIADVALKRVQSDKDRQHVHLVTSRKLEKILDQTLKGRTDTAQIGMFMDSGALFKDYDNLKVAKAIRKRVNKPVLFFMRDPKKDEKTPDTLALLPLDSDTPRMIGGTRLEDIGKTGLGIEDYIVYADERHTTGTDIPLPYNAIGLMTIDETMLRRTFFQTILRLRQFFAHQTVEYVIPEKILPTFPQAKVKVKNEQLKIVLGCLMGALRNQALQKSRDYYRSRKQKLDSLFEQKLLEILLVDRKLTLADFAKLKAFKKVMEIPCADAPYDQVGALGFSVNTIEDLENYAKKRMRLFRDSGGDEEIAAAIEVEMETVIATAKASPWLPKNVMSPTIGEMGMEVDILTEVNQEIEDEMQEEIDLELLKELNIYENVRYRSMRKDDDWDDKAIAALLLSGEMDKGLTPTPLPELFDEKHYAYPKDSDFSHVFDHRICATPSWISTTNTPLPVFHHLQRPAENILVIKTDEGFKAVLLSIHEADQFKDFLHRKYDEGKYNHVWLILPDLSPLEDNPAGTLRRDDVNDLLVQVNAFNGNISYLETHSKQTKKWLKGTSTAMKLKFLSLKVARDTSAKKRFSKSPLFNATLSESQKPHHFSPLYKKVAEMKTEEIQAITKDNKRLLLFLNDIQLQKIKPSQVSLLHPAQLSKLRGPDLVSQIPEEHKERIVREQFSDLTEAQKQWLEEDESTTTESLSSSEESEEEELVIPNETPADLVPDLELIPDAIVPLTEEREELIPADQKEIHTSPPRIRKTMKRIDDESDLLPLICNAFDDIVTKKTSPPPTPETSAEEAVVANDAPETVIEDDSSIEEKEDPISSGSSSSTSQDESNSSVSQEVMDDEDQNLAPKSSSNSVTSITGESKGWSNTIVITLVALAALGGVAAFAISTIGAFGLMGAYASWAPTFMVTLGNALGPFYAHYILTVAGPAYLLGTAALGGGTYYLFSKNQ